MTVKLLGYRGDGSYFLNDPALELAGLRDGPPGRVLRGRPAASVRTELERLLSSPLASGRRAFDVIVAAPKPVSVLLAVEPPRVAAAVVALHARGVEVVVDYLCDEGIHVAGRPAAPLVISFTHGVNRLWDPHLHSHVVVGARDEDGVPLDARSLRAHAAAADGLYLATMRDGLVAAASRAAWVDHRGAHRVEGIDAGLVAAMSVPRSRDGRIERGGAKRLPSTSDARGHWDSTAARAIPFAVPVVPRGPSSTIDEHRFAWSLGEGLVAGRDVVRAWAIACTFGDSAARIRAAASLVAPGLDAEGRRAAVAVRATRAVRVLGARPRDPGELSTWEDGRRSVDAYLQGGHAVGAAERFRATSPATLLAVARLDASLAAKGLARREVGRTRRSIVGPVIG
ncbi:MAG TPA: relaxase domain-containing protein [Acidimicrobiales bacterium]